ncbi:DNA methyltransferase [Eubacterium sp. BL-380-WT-2B]
MENPANEPEEILLENLPTEYYRLAFLVDTGNEHLKREMEISIQAGEIVGLLYDEILKQYLNPANEESLKSLNMLCVRLVFCLYAEDADIFGKHSKFYDYLSRFEARDLRRALIDLFKVLDTKPENRDPYMDPLLASFPYVNGGLFSDENIEIPQFNEKIKELLLEKASDDFNWSEISPTIFGAVFESTLNPETRRSGGMHYTSIENIHKVIDPLFLDDLRKELEDIKSVSVDKTREKKLKEYQAKLGSLQFLDPACGSGNFLTETYLSLRRLENKVLEAITYGQIGFTDQAYSPIQVSISQFYGIEINDFAVTVAKTALWIAESQMMKETENVIHISLDFLPLKSYANIIEANALQLDWESVVPKENVNYIMGNPPFIGYSLQTPAQKQEIRSIYIDEEGKPYKTAGKIDYVAGWYFKAAQFMDKVKIRTAFVSTNSITQGEQVAGVWKPLYDRFGIHIDFAYRTFKWSSEAKEKAAVHCVIVGFSQAFNSKNQVIYIDGMVKHVVENISPYLIDAPLVFIESRKKALCHVPSMTTGNRPADGGNLIIEADEYDDFLRREPSAKKYIKQLTGATEYINNKLRYCLWLVGATPSEIRKMPEVIRRVEACRQDRLKGAPDRQKLANTPTLFREVKNPENYIIIPRVSSENRRYIPLGFLDSKIIPTDSATIIEDALIYHFGLLTSNVHMAWMRAVAGRLKSDYRYSKDIVYNNFPWPTPTEVQKSKIEQTAQAILDARALYPDCSLADLYDEATMPAELRKAHQLNDRAVMQAYGLSVKDTSEAQCVAELMRLYQKLVSNLDS